MVGANVQAHVVVVLVLVLTASMAAAGAPSPRVLGGRAAGRGEFPFVVAIYARGWSPNAAPACAGVVLSNRAILTAAGCFRQLGESGFVS